MENRGIRIYNPREDLKLNNKHLLQLLEAEESYTKFKINGKEKDLALAIAYLYYESLNMSRHHLLNRYNLLSQAQVFYIPHNYYSIFSSSQDASDDEDFNEQLKEIADIAPFVLISTNSKDIKNGAVIDNEKAFPNLKEAFPCLQSSGDLSIFLEKIDDNPELREVHSLDHSLGNGSSLFQSSGY
eukprot:TRINITY_DN106900_c0_g1_i1.p2 TRINITY_DN106900_c0_g1~~TRINITY_DN106900_c0_g1_i1.p2  ORF type:complete len:185 (-),score=18.04 TRINITY_DN106900_c0_g1_i1:1018-1572(-)